MKTFLQFVAEQSGQTAGPGGPAATNTGQAQAVTDTTTGQQVLPANSMIMKGQVTTLWNQYLRVPLTKLQEQIQSLTGGNPRTKTVYNQQIIQKFQSLFPVTGSTSNVRPGLSGVEKTDTAAAGGTTVTGQQILPANTGIMTGQVETLWRRFMPIPIQRLQAAIDAITSSNPAMETALHQQLVQMFQQAFPL